MTSSRARFGARTTAVLITTVLTVSLMSGAAHAQGNAPLLLRQPALSATDICFTFAGDIWTVARVGGVAHRLTASPTNETGCKFSPDGRWIAYTGTDAGNADVYVVAAAGGTPKRLTWHPAADIVRGWTPDGAVLFVSTRTGALSLGGRLYVQSMAAVSPVAVDLPSAFDGALSPDGKRLAYMPYQNANQIWKNYRGGRTTPIWIANLADASIERIARDNSTDQAPMWLGDNVYFISDRDGPATLYSYDTKAKKVERVVENHGLDIKSASAGPGAIVYEQFGSIHLYDLQTRRDAPVSITLGGALTEALPRWVNVGSQLQHAVLSPTGVRAAFEARGEIITVPAKKGDARDVTRTTGAAERYPTWSPDGQNLAYFSDAGGGYHLELRGQMGMAEPRTVKLGDDDTYYYAPKFSPDGKRIAYSTSRGQLWYVDVASGKATTVYTDPLGPGDQSYAWSPDSRWLTYVRSIANRMAAVFVYNVATGTATQITDGMSDARSPVFDASGKYIYFAASTDFGPANFCCMMTYDHPVTRSVYAIVLRKDLPSPVAPESDDEKARSDDAAKSSPDAAKKTKPDSAAAKAATVEVRIDFDDIEQRTVALPPPPRNYVGLMAAKPGILLLLEEPLVPIVLQGEAPGMTVHKFDLSERKTEQLLADIAAFDVSRDGEKVLYKQKDRWAIAALAQPIKPGEGALATSDIQVETDPLSEWRQMYHESFRMQRAFFYDPNYHGLDLAATERFYAPYVDNLGSRADLSYLLGEVFGNLTVGHLYIGGPPDAAGPTAPRNGLLGADYTVDNDRWRFARVYAGENWNPDLRAPLTQPGVNVHAGDYLLAVNGNALTANDNVDHALAGRAGKQTVLRVGPNANGDGARDVTVVPLATEAALRRLAWIDENRRTVDKLSAGQLAYIYVPNTANEGYTRFNRYFFAQQDKQGAVVDERFNGGGNIADYMVEYLRRTAPLNYVTSRYGADQPIPGGAIYGPKVMLINEYAGSGGDELPWLFRRYGIGQLVGKRTWGGLVGIGGYPALLDGGTITAPRIALWTPEGEYAVENRGVAPDVEVDVEPAAWRAGHDTQLEKAVDILMKDLATKKAAGGPPPRPAFPTWARDNNQRRQH